MKIGVISDTHGYLDPCIPELFAGVEHILHAGDIGSQSIISALEKIAPVTAVLGNTDIDLNVRLTEVIKLAGSTFVIHHIVNPAALTDNLQAIVDGAKPDVVVFGHTHKPCCDKVGKILFFNPGYAGKPRFRLERTVALLHCETDGIRTEYLSL